MKRNNVKSPGPRPNLLTLPRGFPGGASMPALFALPPREQEFDAAVRHHQAGRFDEAEKICARILARNPQEADALHLRGVMAAQSARFDDAIALFNRAIDINPTAAVYYRNLVNALKDSGQTEAAIKPCRQFLRLQPRVAELHNQLGNLLLATSQSAQAVGAFREAVRLNPKYAEAWNNVGMALAEEKEFDEAAIAYRQSLALQPMPQTWNNLGNVLKSKGQRAEAIECYRVSVKLMPGSAEMWNNLGNTLRDAGTLEESVACLDRAVQLDPNLVSAHWNLSLASLQHGQLQRGFAEYEWRWKLKDFPSKFPQYGKPQWRGEDISGRTLLLHVEQGRGDVIQFIRYAALVAERGGNVILHCPAEIAKLLQHVPGVKQIISTEEPIKFDVHAALMSLPHLLGTAPDTIPAAVPYIQPDADLTRHWHERMNADQTTDQQSPAAPPLESAKRIGLVWAGSPAHANDKSRSIKLSQLASLSRVPGIALYTLQKGPAGCEAKNPPEGMALIDHTADLHDFADTAALIANLDLVIAVDTAVAHLAGAMGKPVWVLVPFSPDWRWMSDRQDSPWYPTMRLFRQTVEGDWEKVIERVAASLTLIE